MIKLAREKLEHPKIIHEIILIPIEVVFSFIFTGIEFLQNNLSFSINALMLNG